MASGADRPVCGFCARGGRLLRYPVLYFPWELRGEVIARLSAAAASGTAPRTTPGEEACAGTAAPASPAEPPPATGPRLFSDGDRAVEALLAQLVDLDDELALLAGSQQCRAEAVLGLVRERVGEMLESQGAETIRLHEWSPGEQRAVKVVETAEPGPELRFLESVSSGLKIKGRLFRKQEVIVGRSKPQ